jgi:hypothetical protein
MKIAYDGIYEEDQWSTDTYGTYDYVHPSLTSDGFFVGQEPHSSVTTTFSGATALFNGQITGASDGISYFLNMGYGVSFSAFGGTFVGGHARGTASSPTALSSGDYLTTISGAAYDGTQWAISGATHVLQGIFINASSTPASNVVEKKVSIGGLTTPMISWDSSGNAIKFNEAQLDSDITFYSDTGTTLVLDGGTTQALFTGGSASAPSISFQGDTDNGLHYVGTNQFGFTTGGTSRMQISSSEIVVNPNKIASNDFKIHGDTVDNIFFADVSADAIGFFNVTPVARQTELTDELTTITHTAPGTPDYAIQDLTNSSGYGFVTQDEGNTVLSVIANLQTRVNELETKLTAYGLLQDAD